MMDERERLQLHTEVGNALQIEALLTNELVKKTFDGILHGLQNSWLNEPNHDARELLWQKGQGALQFVEALRSIINTGKMAQAQLATEDAINRDES